VYGTDILELIAPVVFSAFVDHMKRGLPGDIEDIDDNREIEAHVVS
jgi:hypothetical protein